MIVEDWIIWVVAAVITAASMEPWSRIVHRSVWHGRLSFIHDSHHREDGKGWEANDWLSLAHAPVAAGFIINGSLGAPGLLREVLYGVGFGMTLFGLAYVIVHDGLIHKRLPVQFLARYRFFDRIARAHRVHHIKGHEPYGLFRGPHELRQRHAGIVRAVVASKRPTIAPAMAEAAD